MDFLATIYRFLSSLTHTEHRSGIGTRALGRFPPRQNRAGRQNKPTHPTVGGMALLLAVRPNFAVAGRAVSDYRVSNIDRTGDGTRNGLHVHVRRNFIW